MNRLCQSLACLVFYFNMGPGFAASELFVDDSNGLPVWVLGGKKILSANYAFWDANWKWARQKSEFTRHGPFNYSNSGQNQKLNFHLSSRVQKLGIRKMRWDFELDAKISKNDVVGGGVVFNLDLSHFSKSNGAPILLPDNRGWKYGIPGQELISVEFEPALENVYFERGKSSEIRAFFYKDHITEGKRQYKMTISVSDDIEIIPTVEERLGIIDSANWEKDTISWQSFPIDLSFLNETEKPAGKHGFTMAVDDDLVFEDGTRAYFWGTNITASTLFKTSKVNVQKQARRLSAMGFNLVRLHHHDSSWVNPNIFGDGKHTLDTQRLSKESLDKIDWWIKSLKDEGIYIWLDLHVGRQLKEGDNIYAYDELRKKSNKRGGGIDLKGYNYVNLTIKKAMMQFNRDYVTHLNPYTDLAYKDDPAVVAMLITNENDLTNHFGNRLLPNKNVPRHNEIYMQAAKGFANDYDLPANEIWRSWQAGPSKLFLNDLEYRFNREMIDDLRGIGVKVPIITTNYWGNNPLFSLPALTSGDMIDVHAYGGEFELEKDPHVTAGMSSWMAAGQVAGKPMSVTEWNVSPFPTVDRHNIPLLIASKASHQGWDALMQYAYAQNSLNNVGKPSNWHSHNDPAFLATLPAAALLYRAGHVAGAYTTYYLAPGEALFSKNINPETSVSIRTASEKGKVVIAMPKTKSLPWLTPSSPPENAIIIEDHEKSFLGSDAESATSDTGEIYHNWEEGIYTINTKQSQVAMGRLGDKTIGLANSSFKITTPNATVAIQSLDNKPIRKSGSILVSLGTSSVLYRDLKGREELPFLSQPLKGKITIQADEGMTLYRMDQAGRRERIETDYLNGSYLLNLDALPLTHWLILSSS